MINCQIMPASRWHVIIHATKLKQIEIVVFQSTTRFDGGMRSFWRFWNISQHYTCDFIVKQPKTMWLMKMSFEKHASNVKLQKRRQSLIYAFNVSKMFLFKSQSPCVRSSSFWPKNLKKLFFCCQNVFLLKFKALWFPWKSLVFIFFDSKCFSDWIFLKSPKASRNCEAEDLQSVLKVFLGKFSWELLGLREEEIFFCNPNLLRLCILIRHRPIISIS